MAAKSNQEITLRDRRLLDGAANNMSGEELAQVSGMPAAQAIARVRELLKSRDVFDDIEQKKLLRYSVYKLKAKIEEYDAQVDIKNPKAAEAYLKVIQAIDDMLTRQGKISDEEMAAAAKAQAGMMAIIITKGYMKARAWLEEEYGGLVKMGELDEVFELGMREASLEDE